MRNIRKNDKIEHWVIHRAVIDEVLGSILGSNKQKIFFFFNSLYYSAKVFLTVSLLICLQLKAETHLTMHRPLKQ